MRFLSILHAVRDVTYLQGPRLKLVFSCKVLFLQFRSGCVRLSCAYLWTTIELNQALAALHVVSVALYEIDVSQCAALHATPIGIICMLRLRHSLYQTSMKAIN